VRPLDVFADAIQGWLLDYASKLVELHEDHAGMAVMNLVAAYPETIECYRTGDDSQGKLKSFFRNGMRCVFPELDNVPDTALDKVCNDVRSGLYHASMLKGTVVLDPHREKPVDYSTEDQSFTINPFEFFRRVQTRFTDYVAQLQRASSGDPMLVNFTKYWTYRHGEISQPSVSSPVFGSLGSYVQETVLGTGAPAT
jgi:hypothetical protein